MPLKIERSPLRADDAPKVHALIHPDRDILDLAGFTANLHDVYITEQSPSSTYVAARGHRRFR